jgi:hypothetical protein
MLKFVRRSRRSDCRPAIRNHRFFCGGAIFARFHLQVDHTAQLDHINRLCAKNSGLGQQGSRGILEAAPRVGATFHPPSILLD